MLEQMNITYVVNPRLVRGLDYYNRTTFEIQTGDLGAQNAVAGGGRYDGLVQMLGGPDQPATGFAIGFDRLAEVSGFRPEDLIRSPDLYIAALGEKSRSIAFNWHCEMSLKGIRSEMDFQNRSLKSQMKRADKLGANHVLILGDEELKEGAALFRNMKTKEQSKIVLSEVVDRINNLIPRQSIKSFCCSKSPASDTAGLKGSCHC
jgi:histidyl-tRNA synthetase